MSVLRPLTALFLLSLALPIEAYERRFLATLEDANWTLTENSAIECRIEHQIPRFGQAMFRQEAGRGLQFKLTSRYPFKKGISVELGSESTSWKPQERRATMAHLETNGQPSLFRIPTAVAERVFHELRAGYQPRFHFLDEHPLLATLSTVRFGEAAVAFTQCIEGLYGMNFDDVRISSIHFDHDDEFASIEQEQTAFVNMFDYLLVDDAISEIVVSGHTDHSGLACYNDGLSERRAWYVYDLLIASGIKPELLRVDYFGELKPSIKGNSERSRALNRRVTVELRR